jgi:hypothetical protein
VTVADIAISKKRERIDKAICDCGFSLRIEARSNRRTGLGSEYRVVCVDNKYRVSRCDFVPTEWCDSEESAWQLWRLREQLENPL